MSKDTDEECVMHSKSDNTETMINDNADEVIEELFKSFLSRYQIGLETSIQGSNFIFDCFYLLYDRRHKINLNRGPRIKNTKAIINSIKKMIINAFNTL